MEKPVKVILVAKMLGRMGGAETYALQAAQALQAEGVVVQAVAEQQCGNTLVGGIPLVGMMSASRLSRLLQCCMARVADEASFRFRRIFDRAAHDASIIVVSHISLLTNVIKCRGVSEKRVWLIVYGIDVWREWTVDEEHALCRCDRIVALSSFTAESITRRLPLMAPRVVVIHPMVDHLRYTPGDRPVPAVPRVILTVARLDASEEYKGHDLVMRALGDVERRLGCSVRYVVVGDGTGRAKLEKQALDLSVADRVVFAGRPRDDSELLRHYRDCHLFAMPSYVSQRPDGSWTGEGFGIVYLEAAACGKPVLACDKGGQTEAVVDGVTGLLVKPSVETVADGIVKLLADPSKGSEMGEAGRRFVAERFTQDVFRRKWAELLAN